MNYKYLLASFLVLLIGCEQPAPLTFENIHLSLIDDPDCSSQPCPIIDIDYPVALGEDEVSISISTGLENRIIESFQINPDGPKANTVEDAIAQFTQGYRADKAEFPDMNAQYEVSIILEESFRNEKLICFRQGDFKYTGGAHGNGVTLYQYFDLQSGQEFEFDKLIADRDGLANLAEEKFRAKFNIGPSESINSPGFWFEEELFALPETFGLEEDQLMLVYNTYEIASYADGTVEVAIPLNEVSEYLNLE
ncbi:DUF3298 and DUF4163 domain-containing protein [Aureitalea marina]|uniref:DUF3298 domain-containing protein n=1 Tax=Aureitalea marina TaxID=930804 RepID=A0A2S7KRP6_9FLAO|nr:DUF3298 and DUF4163 domain-containing protein [Aureitalea marina]PQB05305.1 hypothetical protein BST85_10730 [Aureitalea marina]